MYINDETCKTIVEALIIFRLDYGNAFLYNILLSLTNGLQRVQNRAARLVTWTRKGEHIIPGYQKPIQQGTEIILSQHQLPGCGTSYQTTLNSHQVKIYFVRSTKPTYLNWRIYNFKPVYYVWYVFELNDLRICFDYVFNVKRIRAIKV